MNIFFISSFHNEDQTISAFFIIFESMLSFLKSILIFVLFLFTMQKKKKTKKSRADQKKRSKIKKMFIISKGKNRFTPEKDGRSTFAT